MFQSSTVMTSMKMKDKNQYQLVQDKKLNKKQRVLHQQNMKLDTNQVQKNKKYSQRRNQLDGEAQKMKSTL